MRIKTVDIDTDTEAALRAATFEGGVLIAIMSPHWTFAEDAASRNFRDWQKTVGGLWELNDPKTFASSGTNVNTGIFTVRKPLPKSYDTLTRRTRAAT